MKTHSDHNYKHHGEENADGFPQLRHKNSHCDQAGGDKGVHESVHRRESAPVWALYDKGLEVVL